MNKKPRMIKLLPNQYLQDHPQDCPQPKLTQLGSSRPSKSGPVISFLWSQLRPSGRPPSTHPDQFPLSPIRSYRIGRRTFTPFFTQRGRARNRKYIESSPVSSIAFRYARGPSKPSSQKRTAPLSLQSSLILSSTRGSDKRGRGTYCFKIHSRRGSGSSSSGSLKSRKKPLQLA